MQSKEVEIRKKVLHKKMKNASTSETLLSKSTKMTTSTYVVLSNVAGTL